MAVKRLKTGYTDTDSRGFHQEIEALKALGSHKYIVSFVLELVGDFRHAQAAWVCADVGAIFGGV